MISLYWCRFDALLSGLINLSSYIDFHYWGLYCCLSYEHDIICLKLYQNRLSNHLMNWFWVCYKPQIIDIKCNVMSPYTLHVLVRYGRSSRCDGSDCFITWIAKKWKVNVLEVEVIFVPYYGKKSLEFFVMNDECFLHYNYLRLPNCTTIIIFIFIWWRCGLFGEAFATGSMHGKIVQIHKFGYIV